MSPVLLGLWMYTWGFLGGWALRALWINRRFIRREIRLAEDALLEQNLANATRHVERANTMLEVL